MHSKILQAMVVATLAAAPLAAWADTAPGEQKGDWIIRAGFSQVNPKEENLNVPALDTFVVVDSDISHMPHTFFRQTHDIYPCSTVIVVASMTRRSCVASPTIRPTTFTRSAGTGSLPMLIGVLQKKIANT